MISHGNRVVYKKIVFNRKLLYILYSLKRLYQVTSAREQHGTKMESTKSTHFSCTFIFCKPFIAKRFIFLCKNQMRCKNELGESSLKLWNGNIRYLVLNMPYRIFHSEKMYGLHFCKYNIECALMNRSTCRTERERDRSRRAFISEGIARLADGGEIETLYLSALYLTDEPGTSLAENP